LTAQENPGCLTLLLEVFGLTSKPEPKPRFKPSPPPTPKPKLTTSFPYHQRDDFLSPAEISFYHILRKVIGDGASVCPKVSLGDLFYAQTGDYGENRSWMNRIDRKHIDFVICDPKTMRPIMGIELDDASHQKEKRIERDQFVDRVFSAAGLPLARVTAQAQYNTSELTTHLRQAMAQKKPTLSRSEDKIQQAASEAAAVPPCPRCGAPMVLRQAKRGARKGEEFWGCPNFPKCRGTRDLDQATDT
jgi:predicted RNA-binding Zn-ribbon protein involved in translation (DUF1610 family)